MSRFLLDTNLLVGIIRESTFVASAVRDVGLFSSGAMSAISVVSAGEIWSLAYQFNWGDGKRNHLRSLLGTIPMIRIDDEIVERYAEIDAYSQGVLPGRPLSTSARNMGKNDLWIAATASVFNATVVTTDHDFDHLHGEFCTVEWIDPTSS